MEAQVERIKSLRRFLLEQVEELTADQLNAIPTGFRNNIIWNLGHLTSAVQSICYSRAGLPVAIDEAYVSPYLPGTKPERYIEADEIAVLKTLAISSLDQLQADVAQHSFSSYSPSVIIPKIYGVEVTNIQEALNFLLYHEGFHAGYVLALKHLLRAPAAPVSA